MTILTHNWNGYEIHQASTDIILANHQIPAGYVNATQMCKACNKKWNDYARLNSSKTYWEALSADTGILASALIVQILGGGDGSGANTQGTWVHFEIAIDLAAWASIDFRIWANRTLKSLFEKREETKPGMSKIQILVQIVNQMAEQEQKMLEQQRQQKLMKEQLSAVTDRTCTVENRTSVVEIKTQLLETRVESLNGANTGYISIRRYCNEHKIKLPLNIAKNAGKLAAKLCKTRQIPIGSLKDEMYGTVGTYPYEIVEEAIAIAQA